MASRTLAENTQLRPLNVGREVVDLPDSAAGWVFSRATVSIWRSCAVASGRTVRSNAANRCHVGRALSRLADRHAPLPDRRLVLREHNQLNIAKQLRHRSSIAIRIIGIAIE